MRAWGSRHQGTACQSGTACLFEQNVDKVSMWIKPQRNLDEEGTKPTIASFCILPLQPLVTSKREAESEWLAGANPNGTRLSEQAPNKRTSLGSSSKGSAPWKLGKLLRGAAPWRLRQ
eukprot:scaffold98493_cov19-Tisochrysis_lutea.AAC.1